MNILAIDIGGSFIKYATMTEDMQILDRGRIATPQEGRKELIEALGRLYDAAPDAKGIAISLPGIIDSEKGHIIEAGALSYNIDFYMGDALFRRCAAPIWMENDAKCAALAESAPGGALSGVQDGFVIIFGTMVGGGYIKDGKLCRGRHFSAGEVSNIITDRAGNGTADEFWGNRCGVPQLCLNFAEKKKLDPAGVNGVTVFKAVDAGDPDALEILNRYAHEVAVQIFNLQNILDVERFAIGGGISGQESFLHAIRENLTRLYDTCPYPVPRAQVVPCRYGNDANLYGALRCFLSSGALKR